MKRYNPCHPDYHTDDPELLQIYDGFETIVDGKPLKKKLFETIVNLLISGKLKHKYIISLLKNPEVITCYERAFTHKTFDPIQNYEFYEFLGDGTVNNCVIWYVARKFSEYEFSINPSEVLTRVKITLISKQSLADFAKEFGFWDYIRATIACRQSGMKDLLEDVFEAFIGVTQWVIDQYIGMGAGYAICYNIIASLLDKDPRILSFVERRNQGKPAIDFFAVCDPVTILKQTMEDKELGQQSIGRIIPNPDPRVIQNESSD